MDDKTIIDILRAWMRKAYRECCKTELLRYSKNLPASCINSSEKNNIRNSSPERLEKDNDSRHS